MQEKIDLAIEVVKAKIHALTVHADMQKVAQSVLNLEMANSQYAQLNPADKEFDKELVFVLGRVRSNLGATEMQQVTQAALHLMTAKAQSQAVCFAAAATQEAKQQAKATKTKND